MRYCLPHPLFARVSIVRLDCVSLSDSSVVLFQALQIVFNLLVPEGTDELDDDALLPLLQLCPDLPAEQDLENLAIRMITCTDANSNGAVCFDEFVAALRGTDAHWAAVHSFMCKQRESADALFGQICRQGDSMNLNLLKQHLKLQKLATDSKQAKASAQAMLAGAQTLDRDGFARCFMQAQLVPHSAWRILVDGATPAAGPPAPVPLPTSPGPTAPLPNSPHTSPHAVSQVLMLCWHCLRTRRTVLGFAVMFFQPVGHVPVTRTHATSQASHTCTHDDVRVPARAHTPLRVESVFMSVCVCDCAAAGAEEGSNTAVQCEQAPP